MCGIAGLWDGVGGITVDQRMQAIRRMTRALAHRGPDDEGYVDEVDSGLSLGHRRLSIVDLSPLGHQPMVSGSGRYVIAFNGEVFNHRSLRSELEPAGYRFKGTSDTEVMLAAIEQWGLASAISRFIGMFAFALWDRRRHVLTIARDRLGIKPLYYGWIGRRFAFASELKALRIAPGFDSGINRSALALQLKYGYIPAPYSIYENLHKLSPGTLLSIDLEAAKTPLEQSALTRRAVTYWSARDVAERGAAERLQISAAEAGEQLEDLLQNAIALRMEADVPLGAFLSGGVDSSTVVALMQKQSSRPVKTFSIGFPDFGFDEAPHASAVAQHLGTEHSELYVSAAEALQVVPRLPQLYDEPFSDASQIPTFLVSKLARQHVTVCLSGDGGDELFAGYDRYFWALRLWGRIDAVPNAIRRTMAKGLLGAPGAWAKALELAMPLLPRELRVKEPLDKINRFADLVTSESLDDLYDRLVSHWPRGGAPVFDRHDLLMGLVGRDCRSELSDPTERMMYADLVGYLPDDILVKVDRASMAVGLEARVPLLDHRIVEFAWRLPVDMKLRGGGGKWLLRQVLYRHVPRALIERPKQGFGVPLGAWLRGPLRDWAESLLDERQLREAGLFEPATIRTLWIRHVEGVTDASYRLWDVLMFQAWFEEHLRFLGQTLPHRVGQNVNRTIRDAVR
jgi:asparagine synthase (glutamine-hydrolysing)